jgi:hypothetical protein
MTEKLKKFGPPIVTLALLVYTAAFSKLQIVTAGVDQYLKRCAAAIENLPLEVGDFRGKRQDMEARARDFLMPNAERTILYTNWADRNQQAFYSVIQTPDARFMTGHAPPNCYPGNGYTITEAKDRVWKVGELEIKGIQYRVERNEIGGLSRRTVQNFYIFPDGHFGASLKELDRAAEDYRQLKFGVTQVQLVTHTNLSDTTRDEIFQRLVGSERSLEMIRTLRTGISK